MPGVVVSIYNPSIQEGGRRTTAQVPVSKGNRTILCLKGKAKDLRYLKVRINLTG